jgi:hypothetical protein
MKFQYFVSLDLMSMHIFFFKSNLFSFSLVIMYSTTFKYIYHEKKNQFISPGLTDSYCFIL